MLLCARNGGRRQKTMLLQLQLVYIYGIVAAVTGGSPSLLRTTTLRQRRNLLSAKKTTKTGNIKVDRPGKGFLESDVEVTTGFMVSIDLKKAGEKMRDIEMMILQLEPQSTWRFGVQKQKTDGSPKQNIKIWVLQ